MRWDALFPQVQRQKSEEAGMPTGTLCIVLYTDERFGEAGENFLNQLAPAS